MSLPNRIPELDQNLVSSNKTVYYLQKIFKYDEGYTDTCILGVWDSPDGDIDKIAQKFINQEKEFCEYNKFVKPHTMTMRKVKATISSEVVESQSEHYGTDHSFKRLECTNCHGRINYGDEVVIKEYDTCDKYFCCSDCLAEYENSYKLMSDDENYDKLFINVKNDNKFEK